MDKENSGQEHEQTRRRSSHHQQIYDGVDPVPLCRSGPVRSPIVDDSLAPPYKRSAKDVLGQISSSERELFALM